MPAGQDTVIRDRPVADAFELHMSAYALLSLVPLDFERRAKTTRTTRGHKACRYAIRLTSGIA